MEPPLPTEVGGEEGGSSFPTTREEFEADPRVSWSRLTGKWALEADDGTEFEYDEGIKRWVPVVCFSPRLAVWIVLRRWMWWGG